MKILCPLCDEERTHPVGDLSDRPVRDFSVTAPLYGAGRRLWRCAGCGVTFAWPLPDEATLKKAYAEMEDPSYLDEAGHVRAAQEVLARLERLLGHRGLLLDVGCFCGVLLSEARRRGWQVAGVEPSRWARERARERFGLDIRHGSLAEAAFPENDFEGITALDVLEHFLDPRKELAEIRRILKPGGLLFISTPDIASLAARVFRNRWWGYRQEHLFYFSRPALRHFLAAAGFACVWEGCYRRVFSVGGLLRRLRGISPATARCFSAFERIPALRDRQLWVNLHDCIALVARKE